MLIEAHRVERGARVAADICVVGTGPAGITLLKELSRTGLHIVALESGGQAFDPNAQALCDGATISQDNYPSGALMTSRRRQLGGTANLWDDELEAGQGDELVRLVALDAIDFEKRPWVPHSGWPFGKSELERFYDRALSLVGAARPDDADSPLTADHPELLAPEARLGTVLSRFASRTVFTRDLPEALASDEAISVYLNATLLELVLDDNAVNYARVAVTPEREFRVTARFFVLAAGGIENARVLLLSNGTHRAGLGNQHDLVGRFFMDHPAFRLGVLTPSNRKVFRSAGLYDHHLLNGQRVMGKFTFHEKTMRQEEMLNICVTLTPRGRDYESAATKVLKRIINSGSAADAATLLRQELRTLTSHWDEVLAKFYHKLARTKLIYFENKGGWSRVSKPERRFRRYELMSLSEQAPNPENRVTLADGLDRFGQRKAQLHWQWSDVDLRSIRRAQDIVKEELEQQGLGEFVRQHELDESDRPSVASPHHHIGTTRMHIDPREGVVDANCQVHGVSNLYVTGSSVFPTGGFANPTLTIVALAIRLSYHLKELMKPPFSSASPTVTAPSEPQGA
jgi:choline dehydrogenase-like flavoprotein